MLVGVGGIGTGLFFALEGDGTLGRNESRTGRLLDVRDYCKLHIIAHYVAVLLGAKADGGQFRVVPIGLVGADAAGRRLVAEMAETGMDTRFVRELSDRPTTMSVCFQYPDGSGGNITTSNGASAALTPADIDEADGLMEANAGRFIALAAPEVSLEARMHLLKLATDHRGFRAAAFTSAEVRDACGTGILSYIDLLAVNEDEAGVIVGEAPDPGNPAAFLFKLRSVMAHANPDIRVILSVGKHGAFALERGRWDFCPALNVPVASTAGAGDAMLGAAIAAIAAVIPLISPEADGLGASWRKSLRDRPMDCALDFATLLAALTVTSPHTIHPHANLQAMLDLAADMGLSFAPSLEAKWASAAEESEVTEGEPK